MSIQAIHIIWTCYMTWLPGDARGHWSPLWDMYGRLVAGGHRLNLPDACTRQRAQELAKEPKKILSDAECLAVEGALRNLFMGNEGTPAKAGAKYAHALAVEPTHVHLLVSGVTEPIDRVVGRLKGSTSSAIVAIPQNAGRRRTWTTGYWKVFLHNTDAVDEVYRYIEEHNRRRGRASCDWLCPL